MADHADGDERPRKIPKVKQNHKIVFTAIDTSCMDHFCKVIIAPDRLHQDGIVKHGIKINLSEFSKGIQVLGARCNYRLLTPLSSHAYMAYLHKSTEEYLENRVDDGPEAKPVIEVFNQAPFIYQNRNFVSLNGEKVFEIFNIDKMDQGFAKEINLPDLPFILNWGSGVQAKNMQVDDVALMTAMTEMINCFDELQPNIPGLGLCALTEFGRILLYNLLVDGDREGGSEDSDEEVGPTDQAVVFRGYKQMILIINSQQVETGKSFLADLLLRIFHGRKVGLNSTISFDSCKELLRKGEPIVVDDYNNDGVGATLLSRGSKAIWGQSTITLRNKSIVPRANLVICCNERIRDLKVDGKNCDEIFMKFSVLDVGEEQLSKCANKDKLLQKIVELSKVIRKNFPSFVGFILQACGKYITREEFQEFSNITKHERLANLLKNCRNVFDMLGKFCESKKITKPRSLIELNVSSLTNKSELALKLKTPDQLAEILISQKVEFVETEHNNIPGIAFDHKHKELTKYPWLSESIAFKQNGVPAYSKMRTRRLGDSGEERRVAFISFEMLDPSTVKKLKEALAIEERELNPEDIVINFLEEQCKQYIAEQMKIEELALIFIMQKTQGLGQDSKVLKCQFCKFVSKSKRGLATHQKKCEKNK